MIRPPDWTGVAFSGESDGDIRNDLSARSAVSSRLGIGESWAEARQVHGNRVVTVDAPGLVGDADGIWTTRLGLPVAVFTADCFGVVVSAQSAVGVAHAGWRGAASGVVEHLREEMTSAGHAPTRAAIGPGIGPCCFEVGEEVVDRFHHDVAAETTWGTASIDLRAVLEDQLRGLAVWNSGACTRHEEGWFSHRADATPKRLASIGWLA